MTDESAGFSRVCPNCGRRVPRSVAVCRCGTTFAADTPPAPAAAVDPSPEPAEAPSEFGAGVRTALSIVGVLALVGFVVYRSTRPDPMAPSFGPSPAPSSLPASRTDANAAAGPARGGPARLPQDAAAPPAPDAAAPPAPPAATDPPLAFEDVVSRAMPAVAQVETPTGRGTAFFVRADTLLTNVHVVGANTVVTVRRFDGSVADARVETKVPTYDLAVLRMSSAPPNQPTIPLGSLAAIRVGQEVFTIGSALGTLQNTVTRGIVSAVRQTNGATLVQTDAAANPGNSGGPLLDRTGTAIGITTMGYQGSQGLNFAVAIDHARAVLEGRLPSAAVAGTPNVLSGLTPSAPSENDRRRVEAEQLYERVVTNMAAEADKFEPMWRQFREECYSGSVAGTFDREWFALLTDRALPGAIQPRCDKFVADVKREAFRFRDAMRQADDAARAAGVFPGFRRDARRRHKLEHAAWE